MIVTRHSPFRFCRVYLRAAWVSFRLFGVTKVDGFYVFLVKNFRPRFGLFFLSKFVTVIPCAQRAVFRKGARTVAWFVGLQTDVFKKYAPRAKFYWHPLFFFYACQPTLVVPWILKDQKQTKQKFLKLLDMWLKAFVWQAKKRKKIIK